MGCVASWAQITSGIMDEVRNPHTAEGSKGMHGSEKPMRGAGTRGSGMLLEAKEIHGAATASSGKGMEMPLSCQKSIAGGTRGLWGHQGPNSGVRGCYGSKKKVVVTFR